MNIYFDPKCRDKITTTLNAEGVSSEEIDAVFALARISGVRAIPSTERVGEFFYMAKVVDGKFDKFA